MQAVTIDSLNNKVMNLLKEMGALGLIRLAKQKSPGDIFLVDKRASVYKGIISSELADQLQEHIGQSRNQWQHLIDCTSKKLGLKINEI